jgi:transposase
MSALSQDLRERVIAAVDHREGSRREIAQRFRVDVSCITRLLQLRRQTGSLRPRPHGGGRPPARDGEGLERPRALVRKRSDATLEQLRQGLGLSGSIMVVWRALKTLDITVKKKSRHADERNRPDVQRKRHRFRRDVKAIDPKRLVFVDRTGVTTAMTPTYGRAPRGERVDASAPASWESVTLTAAVGLDGPRAPLAFLGATNATAFRAYVEGVLAPAPRPGDVVVFHNMAPHLKPGRAEAIERAGASVLPPPPYSPDYTPIEEMLSKVKAILRRIGARSRGALYDAFGEALRQVTTQDILGWFRHVGLCATPT